MIKRTFHHGWTVETGDGGTLSALFGGGTGAKAVTLPHDHLVEIPRNPQEPNGAGNGYFHEEDIVYKAKLDLEPEAAGKRVFIEFEGIYQNAFVYVNESYAGKCAYGYSNFYLDITRFVLAGHKNDIKVIVKNGVPSGRWYTGGGIYRDVNIMVADPVHIAPDGVFVHTEDVADDLAAVNVDVELQNDTMQMKSLSIRAALTDAEGGTVAEGAIPVTMNEGEKAAYRLHLFVKNPSLWDEDSPYLYQYRVDILAGEDILDTECGTFGIRRLQLDPVHGLRVNGKTVKLRGGCIHHDNGVIGAKEFPFAAEYRVKKLKEAGFNAIRSSHYPMSRHLLRACDKYGMYVMDEYSDVWTTSKVAYDYSMHMTEWWEHDIENMVRKDRNHPSVIMYSIGNEIPETGNPADAVWGKKFADKIRSFDPTRYTTNSMNLLLSGMPTLKKMAPAGTEDQSAEINTMMSSLGEFMAQLMQNPLLAKVTEEAAGQVDIVGYNYALGRYEPEGTEYPNRILVGSETNPPDLDKNWEAVMKLPYVIGDFDWTAWDYLGETGIGATGYGDNVGPMGMMYAPYPYKAGYCGDINLTGGRRPVSYWREIIWGHRTAPYIAVQPAEHYGEKKSQSQWVFTDAVRSWNFAGFEGKGIVVEVYADADEVELFVNGRSVGRKAPGETKKALTVFDTIYEAGEVETAAYKNGAEIGRDKIVTASEGVKLTATVIAREAVLPADGSDIAYADVCVLDAAGNLNPADAKEVSVEVEGPGVLTGYGSASPCSEENYYDTCASTFEGRIRAAVRACGTGTIRVTFKAEGMETAVEIEAV
ncbi:MAG: DUF4982 domain-containing protein [Lachnospiraceae bacterium]|nr:DUF4982 domain-containing protein [Lachnospiraceae bacterium]